MRRWQSCLLAGLTLLVGSWPAGATEPHASPAAIRKQFASGNIEGAKTALLDCADAQNGECQHYLGKLVEEGKVFEADVSTARQLFELAYRNGYEPAGADILRLTRTASSTERDSPAPAVAEQRVVAGENGQPASAVMDAVTRQRALGDFSFLELLSPDGLCQSRQRNRERADAADQALNDALDREFHRRANVGGSVSCIGAVASAHGTTRSEPQRGTRSSTGQGGNGPSVGMRIATMIAQGIGAIGEGMARGSGRGDTVIIGEGCRSDFNCSFGERCVKPPMKSKGVCLKAVDSYGLPTLDGPSMESIYPRTDLGCISSAECPVGFRCNSQLKVCTRP